MINAMLAVLAYSAVKGGGSYLDSDSALIGVLGRSARSYHSFGRANVDFQATCTHHMMYRTSLESSH